MNNRIMLFVWVVIVLSSAIVFAQEKGKKEIMLEGGRQGNVPFSHHMHQDIIKDCMVCHADFSQVSGSIMAAKKAGILKKKQVMNKTCIKCHRAKKKAGEKYGPIKCSKCHIK